MDRPDRPGFHVFQKRRIPVVVKVPIFVNEFVCLEHVEAVEAAAEHLVQVSHFLCVGVEAARIQPV